jgi:hypothetical protein
MKVKIHWNPFIERFVMCDMLGKNMLEFPDCGNFNVKYPGLRKGTIRPDGTPSIVNVVDDPPAKVLAVIE